MIVNRKNNFMENLETEIEKFRKYGQFPIGPIKTSLVKRIIKLYEENIQLSRGSYLMQLCAKECNSFFDIPSVPSLFSTIYAKPLTGITKYPPMYIQILSSKISLIYEKPLELAIAVCSFFRDDISYVPFFAYSSFPGLFSGFVGEGFCSSASDFLVEVFDYKPSNYLLSSTLLATYFSSATVFFDHFWSKISGVYGFFKKEGCFEEKTQKFINCLTSSLPHLSKYHTRAFREFSVEFASESKKFLVNEIFIQSFDDLTKTSIDFLDQECTIRFREYLVSLGQNIHKETLQSILNIIINNQVYLAVNPTLKGSVWFKGVPIIISDRDVHLVHQILEKSKVLKWNYTRGPIVFSENLSPMRFNVFPSFVSENKEEPNVCKDLFDERPSMVEIPQISGFERKWREIITRAYEDKSDVITYTLNSDFIKKNDEFKKYALLQLVNYNESHYNDIETAILSSEQLHKMTEINISTRLKTQALFHQFSFKFVKQVISKSSKWHILDQIEETIAAVITNTKTPRVTYYEISTAVLDTVELVDINDEEMMNDFSELVLKWMKQNWNKYQCETLISYRMKYLIPMSNILARAENATLGQQLKLIIMFQRNLRMILNEKYELFVKPIFNFCIFSANNPKILKTFLFYHHLVFSRQSLVQQWDTDIIYQFDLFGACMWSLLQNDMRLYQKYIETSECESLFLC